MATKKPKAPKAGVITYYDLKAMQKADPGACALVGGMDVSTYVSQVTDLYETQAAQLPPVPTPPPPETAKAAYCALCGCSGVGYDHSGICAHHPINAGLAGLSPTGRRRRHPLAVQAAPRPTYRTQKVRGVMALRDDMPFDGYYLDQGSLSDLGVAVFPHAFDFKLPAFARPCPTVPRHGFVDSHEVHDMAGVLNAIAKTMAADPNGEVIFMPRLSGKWSGVVTHAGVTFGKANDGATAGKSARTIPAYEDNARFARRRVGKHLIEAATCKEAPYLEFVEHEGLPMFVQLRDGPEVPRSANFIPERVVVAEVVTTNGEDLLAWEALIAEYAGKPGVVVHHPGGSLTSHYSVHAIVHRIPVILDAEAPKVGDVLEPAGWEPKALTDAEYETLARLISGRFAKGFGDTSYDQQKAIVETAIATLHAMPQWSGDSHLLRLRAEGVAAAVIFAATACVGEARHWYGEGPGKVERSEYDEETGKLRRRKPKIEGVVSEEKRFVERESVYTRALDASIRDLRRWVKQAREDFNTPGWDGGYGGPKWAECCDVTLATFSAAATFLDTPNAENWAAVVSAYNQLIHVCHNGGAILTKWIVKELMDNCAENPGPAFINPFAASAVLDLDKLPKVTRKATLAEFLQAA